MGYIIITSENNDFNMFIPKYEDLNNSNCTEKYISVHYPEFHTYINKHYPKELKWTEKLYWYYNELTEKPVCVVCGNPVRFINIKEGYKKYCSCKCACNSKEVREKAKQTWIKKYGVENPSYNKQVVAMRSKVQQERYGGVGFASKELMEKTKKTNLERYGYENAFQNPETQEKQKQTCLEKYGVENPFESDEVKEKIKQTNLERYGYENAFQNPEIQEKQKQTCLELYGAENPFELDEIKEKIKQSLIEKYGVDHPLKLKTIKERIKQTNIERYGYATYTQTDEYKIKEYQTKKQNHSFNSSKIEQDFKQWLIDNNIEFKYQYRSDDYPFNCDFYFPDKDLYLEIQGSWTHGKHPFDENDNDDIELLNGMFEKGQTSDFYKNAIEVWTKSDPKKRQWVKEHNLNWIEVFSTDLEEVKKQFLEHYK